MRVGALVVGIEKYTHAAYRDSVFRLQYAVADAKAFARYLSSAWRDHQLFMQCLSEEEATADRIEQAAELLAAQHVEILFVYLSGHGDMDPEGDGWFCLVDAERGKRSLDGAALDRIFAKIDAPTSLLMLDCCYAESVLSRSRFFSNLQNAHARLFLCSSRARQRTWEDEAVKQGIFSNLLLRGLSTISPIASPTGLVDVEAALFPYLCEQVPLAVMTAKGRQRQEPVKGGVSSGPVRVPSVSAQLLGRQLSTYDLVRLGTRRWLWRIAVAAVAGLAVVQLCFYHVVIGPAGDIEVLSGLKATEPFTVLGSRIDTGITRDDLVTRDEDPAGKLRPQLVRLAEGGLWGSVLQRQADGMETWFGQVMPLLSPGARARATVLATGRLPRGYRSAAPDQESPPFRAILDAAFLKDEEPPDRPTALSFSYKLPKVPYPCRKPVAGIYDERFLHEDLSVIASELDWSVARAVLKPSAAIAGALDGSRLVSYRIAHPRRASSKYNPGMESEELADVLSAIVAIRSASTPATPGAVVPVSAPGSWCEPGFDTARLFLGNWRMSRAAALALAANVKAFGEVINDPLASAKSQAALAALRVYARARKLPGAAVDAIIHTAKEDGLSHEPEITDWLRAIAPHQKFSSKEIAWLFSQMNPGHGSNGYGALVAFDVLSRTAKRLQEDQKRLLAAWYAKEIPKYRAEDLFADAAGYLGAVTDLSPNPVSFLAGRLVPEIYVSGRTKTRLDADIIRSTDFRAGVSLGVIGQSKRLPRYVTDELYQFANARANLGGLRDVYGGLARQRSVPEAKLPDAIVESLVATRGSYANRRVEVGIAIAEIVDQEPAVRKRILTGLGEKWRSEAEPEVRMALARVMVDSKLRIDGISLPRTGTQE